MNLKESQKSHVPTETELEKKWYLVDVNGKSLGSVATKITNILRGKEKPYFTPQRDCGDYVVVLNAKGVRLAKNKMDTKLYQWHTRYPGGFRVRTAKELIAKKPEKIIYDAVWGMLPRTRTRRVMIKRLRISSDEKHAFAAQNPKPIKL